MQCNGVILARYIAWRVTSGRASGNSGVLHRSLKNNVSINFNINVDEKSSFQK